MDAPWREVDAYRLLADLVEVPGETVDLATTARRLHAVVTRNLGIARAGIYSTLDDGSLVRVHGTFELREARISRTNPLVVRLREDRLPLRIPVREHFRPEAGEKLAALGVRVIVLIPLLLGETFKGCIAASRIGDDGLLDLPDELLLSVGRLACVALEQARLHALTRASAERDRLLLEAARFASASTDLEATLGKYAEAIAQLTGARRAAIALPSSERPGTFVHRAGFGSTAEEDAFFRTLVITTDGVFRRLMDTRRPVTYETRVIEVPAVAQFFAARGETHAAAIPFVLQGNVIGIGVIFRSEPFDPEVIGALEAVGHEIAAIIASALERDAANRAAEREALGAHLRAQLRDSFDLPKILQNAVESLGKLLRVDRCNILLPDRENPGLIRTSYLWRRDASVADLAGLSYRSTAPHPSGRDEAIVVHDFAQDPRFATVTPEQVARARAFVWVRFFVAFDKGGLAVAMIDSPRRWTDEEVRLIQGVAEHCQIAIARAEIYDDARRRADELELTIAHMADAVVMVNEKLEIVRMNPAARVLLWERTDAPPPGDVDAWNPHVVVRDWDGREVPVERWPIVRAVRHGEVTREGEFVFHWNDSGRDKYLIINASPLRDREGTTWGGVIVLRDVTERRAAVAAAQRTEKLRVVGELAASVAHDINNTLAAVLGRAEMIGASTRVPETRADAELIAQAARDASVVLGRLTRLSQKTHAATPRTPVDLARVAADAVELTRPRWSVDVVRGGPPIVVHLQAPRPVVVRGVPTELREVFTNLILNAVDALPSGGTIRVAVESDGARATFEVEDDGTGMPDEVLAQAFEPFFTTKGDLGTGLGLSISAAIVAAHGGRIDARSTPGSGTCIRGTLPLADDDTPRRPVAVVARRQRVLVVDDDERVRSVLVDILSAQGHAVRAVASGEEALATLEGEGPPDLLLTDVAMNGMSGWALAEEVRRRHARVALIVVSGWAGTATRELLARLRATFVGKPFRTDEIRAAIASALELARA